MLTELLQTIRNELGEVDASLPDRLGYGSSAAEIDAAEQEMGVAFPVDLREYFLTYSPENYVEIFLDTGYTPVSLAWSLQNWRIEREIEAQYPGQINDPAPDVPCEIRSLFFNPRWVSIAQAGNGDLYLYDLDPTPSGRQGQIIDAPHDDNVRSLRAASLEEFCTRALHVIQDAKKKGAIRGHSESIWIDDSWFDSRLTSSD